MVFNDSQGQKLENQSLLPPPTATSISKRGLSAQQFCRNIAQLWQPAIAKRFALERPFFDEP
jgi:hypothetical protein